MSTAPKQGSPPLEVADARPPQFSDEALALRFAARHRDGLRYVAAWGRWLEWTGTRWRPDDTLHAFDLARAVCRVASAECNDGGRASAIAGAKTVAAVDRLAKADRRIAATAEQWDRDPWLLNTPAGTIDLRTGAIRPHRKEDFLTKTTAVAPGGKCPRWQRFLARVTRGDKELAKFLQRVAGYALTGSVEENALFFLYGTGANGKGVFINTVSGVLGDYATTAPMETFVASNTDRHPTDLAGLRGARLVTAIETEEGRRWAESRIKALTGGDRVAARFMRQDFFEFVPQFKLMIAGNHRPRLRSVDEAIRRRMNLIPFSVTIPPKERDAKLADKLRAEWPGILAWMIEGCLEWQREGLGQPEAVRTATADYLEAENTVAQWLEECCTVKSTHWASTTDLFKSWAQWAKAAGEDAGSDKGLGYALESLGFVRKRQPGTGKRGFAGLSVKP